jgi:hypothetical protein
MDKNILERFEVDHNANCEHDQLGLHFENDDARHDTGNGDREKECYIYWPFLTYAVILFSAYVY